MWALILFFSISLKKLINKQSSCQWFEISWRSYDVIVIKTIAFLVTCLAGSAHEWVSALCYFCSFVPRFSCTCPYCHGNTSTQNRSWLRPWPPISHHRLFTNSKYSFCQCVLSSPMCQSQNSLWPPIFHHRLFTNNKYSFCRYVLQVLWVSQCLHSVTCLWIVKHTKYIIVIAAGCMLQEGLTSMTSML